MRLTLFRSRERQGRPGDATGTMWPHRKITIIIVIIIVIMIVIIIFLNNKKNSLTYLYTGIVRCTSRMSLCIHRRIEKNKQDTSASLKLHSVPIRTTSGADQYIMVSLSGPDNTGSDWTSHARKQ